MASSIKGQQNLSYLNELKQKQAQGRTNSGQSVQIKNAPATSVQKQIDQNPNRPDLVNNLNKITGSFKYKITFRSSKRRQMVLDALNKESETTINDDATLKNILKNKNCSREVKTALLLSDKVSLAQKQEILKKDTSGDILAYAKKHKILDQVAYCAVGGMQGTSMPKTEALMTAIFDKDGNFDISHCSEGLKTFFNPSTFTPEERQEIVQQLATKANSAKSSNKVLINTMISCFENNTSLDSIIELSKKSNATTRAFIDAHRTPETFVKVLFDQNEQFTIPENIQNARDFFNPSTFTTKERQEIVKQLEAKANSAKGSNKVLINTMISCFKNNTSLDSIIELSKKSNATTRAFVDTHRTTGTFVNAFFDKNEQFTIPENIQNARDFFNPSTFTTKERQEIVQQLETKKTQDPQTDDDKFNNLKIDMMIAQFQQDDEAMINATLGVANEMFNFVNNKIFDENFNTLEPLQESQLSKLLDQTKSILDIQNIFQKDLEPAKNDQQTKYNNCYKMLCGQLLTKESLLIRDLLNLLKNNKQKINYSLGELKNWNTTLTGKQTMLNMLSKDNYENTLNREKLYQLRLGSESSFNGTKWDDFDTNCKKGLNDFNLDIFKTRYTNEQETQNRENLQKWLNANNIPIKVAEYSLNQMDKLISDVEKAVKNNPNLKSSAPATSTPQ